MLIEPSINDLLEKTGSAYELVNLAAKRARDIVRSEENPNDVRLLDPGCKVPPLTSETRERPVSQAAKELAEDIISYTKPEPVPAAPSVVSCGAGSLEIEGAADGTVYILKRRLMPNEVGADPEKVIITIEGNAATVDATINGIVAVLDGSSLSVGGLSGGATYDVSAVSLPRGDHRRRSKASPSSPVKVLKEELK